VCVCVGGMDVKIFCNIYIARDKIMNRIIMWFVINYFGCY